MKVYIKALNIKFDLAIDRTNTLIIENPKNYREIILNLLQSYEEDNEDWIFSENENIYKTSQCVSIITSIFDIEFYNKKLQKVVLDELYKIAVGEKYYKKTSKLLSDIENYLYELEWEMDYNLDISFENFRDILKTGVKNILEPEEVVERILVYIKLAARLMKTKCLIFIGSQKYFTEAEWKMFENAAICEEIYLFCIGNEEVFASHNKIIIDKDWCYVV